MGAMDQGSASYNGITGSYARALGPGVKLHLNLIWNESENSDGQRRLRHGRRVRPQGVVLASNANSGPARPAPEDFQRRREPPFFLCPAAFTAAVCPSRVISPGGQRSGDLFTPRARDFSAPLGSGRKCRGERGPAAIATLPSSPPFFDHLRRAGDDPPGSSQSAIPASASRRDPADRRRVACRQRLAGEPAGGEIDQGVVVSGAPVRIAGDAVDDVDEGRRSRFRPRSPPPPRGGAASRTVSPISCAPPGMLQRSDTGGFGALDQQAPRRRGRSRPRRRRSAVRDSFGRRSPHCLPGSRVHPVLLSARSRASLYCIAPRYRPTSRIRRKGRAMFVGIDFGRLRDIRSRGGQEILHRLGPRDRRGRARGEDIRDRNRQPYSSSGRSARAASPRRSAPPAGSARWSGG